MRGERDVIGARRRRGLDGVHHHVTESEGRREAESPTASVSYSKVTQMLCGTKSVPIDQFFAPKRTKTKIYNHLYLALSVPNSVQPFSLSFFMYLKPNVPLFHQESQKLVLFDFNERVTGTGSEGSMYFGFELRQKGKLKTKHKRLTRFRTP